MQASPNLIAGASLAVIYGLGPLLWTPTPLVTGIIGLGLRALWVLVFFTFIIYGFIRAIHEHGEGLMQWLRARYSSKPLKSHS